MKDLPRTFETIRRDIGGVDTAILVAGAGRPVVMLHGAATIEGFDHGLALADRFRVLMPSHPGMGLSGDAPHVAGMQDLVIHYLDLIDALELDRPHLIGFSMGGWLAAELAAVASDRFGKVVLVAPAGVTDPDHPATPLGEIAPADLPGYLAHDARVALRYFPGGTHAPPPDAFGAARAREGAALARILAPYGMGHPNLHRFLHRIRNPSLIVWGDHDRLLPAGLARSWASRMPDARVHIAADAGHLVLQEKPATLAAIGDFLAA